MNESENNQLNNEDEKSIAEPVEEQPFIEENSTIFTGKKVYDDKKQPSKKPKRILITIISLVVVVALAGAVVAVVKLIPAKEDATASSSENKLYIKLLDKDDSLVTDVSVENKNAKYDLFYENLETIDDKQETVIEKMWYVKGADKSVINTAASKEFVKSCAKLDAIRKLDDTTLAYGFDTPAATIKVGYPDNGEYTITVGKIIPDESGYYVKTSLDEGVYIVETDTIAFALKKETEFGDMEMIAKIVENDKNKEYFTEGAMTKFDFIEISGKAFGKPIKIVKNPEQSMAINYVMTEPYSRAVSDETLKEYIDYFAGGVSADEVLNFTQSAEALKLYGFDAPLAGFKMEAGDKTETLKIGKALDAEFYSAIVEGKPQIFKIAKTKVKFVEKKIEEYFSSYIIMDDIKTIASVEFKSEGQDIIFNLEHLTGEDLDKDTNMVVKADGNDVKTDEFRNIYKGILVLTPQEYVTEGDAGDEVLKIVLKFNDGRKQKVLSLSNYKDSSRRCAIYLDGRIQGLVMKSSVMQLISDAKTVANGGTIKDPIG